MVVSNFSYAFVGMDGKTKKDRYNNLLDLEKAERAQKKKK